MRKIVLIILSMVLLSSPLYGEIIFQENFDAVQDGWNCSQSTPPGWAGKMTCLSATYDNVTHYCSEITSGGRSGNSLKIWRVDGIWAGNLYCGGLNGPGGIKRVREIYHRWYMKLPIDFNSTRPVGYLKLWRYHLWRNGATGPEAMYINFYGGGGNLTLQEVCMSVNGPGHAAGSKCENNTPPGGVGDSWWYPWRPAWDGQWHCYEIRLKLNDTGQNNGIVEAWRDGKKTFSHTVWNFANATSEDTWDTPGCQIGNMGAKEFTQTSWRAIEFDDYVISTEYIGPVANSPSNPTPEHKTQGIKK